jgi:Tol biopolymer transport system component
MYKKICLATILFIAFSASVYSAEYERNLSPDGRFVTYVRPTQGRLIDTAYGEIEATELWISRVDGSEARMLVRDVYSDSPKKTIAGIGWPQFSPNGRRIYFMSIAWVTSDAVHVIDLESGHEHYLCDGNSLEVIPRGKYAGDLIVSQHRYFLGGGSYDWFWLLTSEGKQIDPIASGDENSLELFREMEIPSSPGAKK